MEKLSKLLVEMAGVPRDEIAMFISLLEKVAHKKHEIILREGQVESYLYFVEKGILRCFLTKERNGDLKDITFNLVFPEWFYSAYDSFISQTPSRYSTECLTEVEMYRISYTNLQKFYIKSKAGEKIGRIAAEKLISVKTKREISLLSDSFDERYLNLIQNYPKSIQEVPLKHIASYIGVTPQALSKIRRRVYK